MSLMDVCVQLYFLHTQNQIKLRERHQLYQQEILQTE